VSYQVLARKYRPQTFEEVVGQAPIVTTLTNAVEHKRIHHAYLFSGLRGVGKTTVARLMAKALNCATGPTPRPCNACPSCLEIAESRSLDVLEIDGASNRGIDAIRELRETVRYSPSRDRFKVYIIDEVHMLTSEAWNALLKTLEEPPAQVVFLFATTDYRKIPVTILSRCQHFEFRKIAHADMVAHLKVVATGEKVQVPNSVIELVGRIAEGSLRDAQSALDQVIAFASGAAVTEEQALTILGVIDRDLIFDFYGAVRAQDYGRLVEIVDVLFEKGYQPVPFLEDLMAYGRDLLFLKVVPEPGRYLVYSPEEMTTLKAQAGAFSEDELLRILELLTREEFRLKNSAHPRYLLEALAIRLARLADLKGVEELIATLEAVPPQTRGGAAPGTTRPGPATTAPPPGPARGPSAAAVSGAGGPTGAAATAAAPRGGDQADASGNALTERILEKIHAERGALGGFLGHAAWVELHDDALEIAFAARQSFFKEKVEARESIDFIQKAARGVTGRAIQVRVTLASPGAARATSGSAPAVVAVPDASPPPEDAESRKERLREKAMQEPVVKTLLDAWNGTLIDVDAP